MQTSVKMEPSHSTPPCLVSLDIPPTSKPLEISTKFSFNPNSLLTFNIPLDVYNYGPGPISHLEMEST